MKTTRLHLLALLAALFLFNGCGSVGHYKRPEARFPMLSVADEDFTFDKEERQRAIHAAWMVKAGVLFELLLDREGNVLKIRVVHTRLTEDETTAFKAFTYKHKFRPARPEDPHPYRAMFLPMRVQYEFETEERSNPMN